METNLLMSAHYLQCRWLYLTNHNREHKDSDEVIDELKHNLKKCCGFRQATNGEQSLNAKVVTADITENETRFFRSEVIPVTLWVDWIQS